MDTPKERHINLFEEASMLQFDIIHNHAIKHRSEEQSARSSIAANNIVSHW